MLYDDGIKRRKRQASIESSKSAKLRLISNSSVLNNAGIAQRGQVTKSDRYLATSLTKEFDQAMDDLNIRHIKKVDKSQLFDILLKLKLIKSVSQANSEFIADENM